MDRRHQRESDPMLNSVLNGDWSNSVPGRQFPKGMTDYFLGDAFRVLSYQFWSTVLQSGARLPIHTLNYWTVQSVVPGFYLWVCLSAILLIVDLWQSFVCFIRSGVTQCTLLMVLYLDRMCQGCSDMRCSGRTSVHLCTALLQNIALFII